MDPQSLAVVIRSTVSSPVSTVARWIKSPFVVSSTVPTPPPDLPVEGKRLCRESQSGCFGPRSPAGRKSGSKAQAQNEDKLDLEDVRRINEEVTVMLNGGTAWLPQGADGCPNPFPAQNSSAYTIKKVRFALILDSKFNNAYPGSLISTDAIACGREVQEDHRDL